MSVVIQISYQDGDELNMILDRLEDLPLKVSNKEYKSGEYKRCYLRSKGKLSTGFPQAIEKYPSA